MKSEKSKLATLLSNAKLYINKKLIRDILTIVVVVILLVFLIIVIGIFTQSNDKNKIKFYFYEPIKKEIQIEERNIKSDASKEVMLVETINVFWEGPKKSNLIKTVSENTNRSKSSFTAEDDTYEVVFDKEYKELNIVDEIIFRSTFTWTLTELSFIKNVAMYVDYGNHIEYLGTFNRDNVVINQDIEPRKTESRQIILYFPDTKSDKIVSETRFPNVDSNQLYAEYIVAELMKGPENSDFEEIFNENIKMPTVTLDESAEEPIIYIDFSENLFSWISNDEETEKLQIYSIVNSLTEDSNIIGEVTNIKKVRFLVEGVRPKEYRGKIDLSQSIERNESYMERN